MNRFLIPAIAACALLCVREIPPAQTHSGANPAARPLRPPYLRKAGVRDSMTVWIVDGMYIRTNIDEEFTNFGQHYAFSFIPDSELWIDREGKPDEIRFFVDHLLVERRLMAKGVPYDNALAVADSVERADRRKAGDIGRLTKGGTLPDPRKAHLTLWKHLASGVSVWIVDGRLVRSVFDIDFTEGGHDHVYEFVPQGEVWIDNDLQEAERPYVLLHELHERNLMASGWNYDSAHAESSRIEEHCRHHPDELHEALAKEGWG
jgi:hypothetical protein